MLLPFPPPVLKQKAVTSTFQYVTIISVLPDMPTKVETHALPLFSFPPCSNQPTLFLRSVSQSPSLPLSCAWLSTMHDSNTYSSDQYFHFFINAPNQVHFFSLFFSLLCYGITQQQTALL